MRELARHPSAGACALVLGVLIASPAFAQSLAMNDHRFPSSIFDQILPDRSSARMPQYAIAPSHDSDAVVPAHLRRQTVAYNGREAPGTVVIDTGNTYLYYVLGGGRAIRYGIGVGREGFTWSGVQTIARKQEWPDWHPPAEMIERQPYLPRFMAGGPGNPMGARAMYLGGTLYRIHGTNLPASIGQKATSGCIRLLNEDVIDLYSRVNIGTKVVVLPDGSRRAPADVASARAEAMQAYASHPRPLPPTIYAPRPAAPTYIGPSSASRIY